jgi:hypothetical protein
MPIKIALRGSAAMSPYRRYLHELITVPTSGSADNGIVLASPYWHTLVVHKQPPTLAELLRRHCNWISTLGDAEFEDLAKKPDYCRFLRKLHAETRADLFPKIDFYLSDTGAGHYWHAKVAIRVINHVPVAAVIGSSNLTSASYFAPPVSSRGVWNVEADVALWRDTSSLNAHFLSSVADRSEVDNSFEIVAEEVRGGAMLRGVALPPLPTLDSQLDWLYRRLTTKRKPPTSWTI